MTVSRGAAGKAMAMFISSICSRSTAGRGRRAGRTGEAPGWGVEGGGGGRRGNSPMKTKIWWWE